MQLDDSPRSLLLAFGELASIQVELLRILEQQARPPQTPPIPQNALSALFVPPDTRLLAWQEIQALRQRAQVVLKWISEQPGL